MKENKGKEIKKDAGNEYIYDEKNVKKVGELKRAPTRATNGGEAQIKPREDNTQKSVAVTTDEHVYDEKNVKKERSQTPERVAVAEAKQIYDEKKVKKEKTPD